MKKFLSLVLALVMTMSLVTVSAGAKDFTDGSKIDYKEAVDVMSAVKVIDGYAEGDFRPSTTLTRGAAAKIICNLILGPTTASALVADAAPYKDVPTNHTFAGYIAYCQKEGIISGYADGTFRPAASLTGYAFMKMLLGALGYDAEVEQYTGPNWSINVAKRALSDAVGLADGLTGDFNGVKAVTREEACLYAFNTLQATMVEYEAKTSVSTGGTTVVVSGSKAKDMVNNAKTEAIEDDGLMQFAEKYFTDLKLEKGRDDFGRPANTWKVKKDEVGTYANRGDLVNTYTKKVTMANVYADLGKTVVDDLKDGDSTLTYYVDGVRNVAPKADIETKWAEKNDSGKVNGTGNGDLTEVYVNTKTNNVTIVTIRTYVYQVLGDYNAKKELVSLGNVDATVGTNTYNLKDKDLELEDYPQIKDYKDEDYVLVTGIVKNGKLDVKSVEKAELVSGEVKGYKLDDNVELGDKTYDYTATFDPANADTRYTVGQQATVVLDKYGYVIAVDKALVLTDYVFINEIGQTSTLTTKAMAEAIFTDGSKKEIELVKVLDEKSSSQIIYDKAKYQGKWYTYSKNANGAYTLYAVEGKYVNPVVNGTPTGVQSLGATQTPSVISYSPAPGADNHVSYNNKVYFLQNNATLKANDDTIFLVSDKDDDVTVYNGVKNAPEIILKDSGASVKVYLLAKTVNGYASVVFMDVTGNATISGEKETNLVYVLKYNGEHHTTDNEVYFTYDVLVDGEKATVKADNKIESTSLYQVANYVTKKNDLLTDFTLVNTNAYNNANVLVSDMNQTNKDISYSAGTLSIGGHGYVVDKDSKINLITLGPVSTKAHANNPGAAVMNKDASAKYEVVWGISAKTLADTVNAYNYKYDFALKTVKNDKEVIDELFVTVYEATATGVTPPTPPVPASTVVTLNANGTVTVVDNSGTLTADQLLAAIEKELKATNHTILPGSPKNMGGNVWKFETKTAQGFYKDYTFDANTGYGKYISVEVNGVKKDTAKGEKLTTLNTVADLAEYGKYFKNDGTAETKDQTTKLTENGVYTLYGMADLSGTKTYGKPGDAVTNALTGKYSQIGTEYKANTEIKYTTGDLTIADTGFYKVELVNAAGETVQTDYKKTTAEVVAAGTNNEFFRYNDGAEKFQNMNAALNVGTADLKVYVDVNKAPVKYAKFANVSLTGAGAAGLTAKSEIAWKDGIVVGGDSYLVLGTEAILEVTLKGYKNDTKDTTITLTNATYKTINTIESGIDGIKGYEGTSTTVLVLQKNTTLNGSFTITAGNVTATDPTPTVAVTVA